MTSITAAYDAVVVGAGPAGLSAAVEITTRGGRCLVIEEGRSHLLRDHNAPREILSGVGGAGLFSDGKHSFFPAATELWRLPDRRTLVDAYEATRRLLQRHDVDAPRFPELLDELQRTEEPRWQLKRYPAIYASLEARKRCIAELYEQCGELPWLSARVIGVERRVTGPHNLFSINVEQTDDRRSRSQTRGVDDEVVERRVEARSIVLATGRLSPRWTREWLEPIGVSFELRRLEIGVRLETRANAPLFTMLEGVDPKLSYVEEDGTRFLTFCTCRDGEVVTGSICNMHSISGRADGPRTSRSSVGILARITRPELVREIEAHMFAPKSTTHPFRVFLKELLRERASSPELCRAFGKTGASIVTRGVERFVEHFSHLAMDSDATLHGPCIEGVGDYPVSDPHLEIAPSIFVAGDVCGRFRGLVASMVSGRYVGARIIGAVKRREAPSS